MPLTESAMGHGEVAALAAQIRAEYSEQLESLRRSVGRVIARADLSDVVLNGDTWAWRGDGTDQLDHMPGSMVVAIRAEDLRALIKP
jgi:hypothetical protein